MSNMYKPYACGLVVHAAIDACIQLRNEHALAPESIARVELTVCPIVMELTAIKEPQTGLAGQVQHFPRRRHRDRVRRRRRTAIRRRRGARSERVVALRRRVTVTPDAAAEKNTGARHASC